MLRATRIAVLLLTAALSACAAKRGATDAGGGPWEHHSLRPQHWVDDEYTVKTYKYADGSTMLSEDRDGEGRLLSSRWFTRSGVLLMTQHPYRDTEYYGVYLDDNGAIRSLIKYRNGVAEGPALYFDEPARPTRIKYMHEGAPYEEHVIEYPDEQ